MCSDVFVAMSVALLLRSRWPFVASVLVSSMCFGSLCFRLFVRRCRSREVRRKRWKIGKRKERCERWRRVSEREEGERSFV